MSDKKIAANTAPRVQGTEIVLAKEQQVVLEGLVVGKPLKELSEAAGVARSTIYRWMKHDAAFRAAYNQWHEQMLESGRSRLLMMVDTAADSLQKALEAGDSKAALELLRGMGVLKARAVGPTDAEEIRRLNDLERRRKNVELGRAEESVTMDEVLEKG
jgi:terminase small subunit-like protein